MVHVQHQRRVRLLDADVEVAGGRELDVAAELAVIDLDIGAAADQRERPLLLGWLHVLAHARSAKQPPCRRVDPHKRRPSPPAPFRFSSNCRTALQQVGEKRVSSCGDGRR
jgi:hypothetical protein